MHDEKEYPEVLFPNRFTHRQPWQADPNFSSPPLPATIPIYRLSHITHRFEARSISSKRGRFTFIPNQKFGKSFDYADERVGVTYKYKSNNTYEKISSSALVFPGYLSWWGIDVQELYAEEEDCELLDSILEERSNGRYVPGYLAENTESQYGDRVFSIELSDILQDYSRARRGRTPCLKVGGTLRYRNEICYVVMVCTEEDRLDMPSITNGSPQFQSNGLVDRNGIVGNYQKKPNFNATSIIKSEKAGPDPTERKKFLYNYFSWEQMVFAFYFPREGQSLKCKHTHVNRFEVSHFPCPKC